MNSLSKNLTTHRILLLTVEVQLRKKYRRVSTKTRVALERWLDKKTSPYGDFTK